MSYNREERGGILTLPIPKVCGLDTFQNEVMNFILHQIFYPIITTSNRKKVIECTLILRKLLYLSRYIYIVFTWIQIEQDL